MLKLHLIFSCHFLLFYPINWLVKIKKWFPLTNKQTDEPDFLHLLGKVYSIVILTSWETIEFTTFVLSHKI